MAVVVVFVELVAVIADDHDECVVELAPPVEACEELPELVVEILDLLSVVRSELLVFGRRDVLGGVDGRLPP